MVDLSFLKQFAKGDTQKMKRYINIYLSITPEAFQQMKQHVLNKEWEQLRVKAHALKPQADYMGIPGLKAVLVEIEQNVQRGKVETLGELYKKAHRIHMQSVPQLKRFVNSQ